MLENALAEVREVTAEQLDALAGADLHFRFGQRHMEFTTADFLLSFAVPNFYFHATSAYDILRMKGVAIGKSDFMGAIRTKAQVAA